MTTVCNWVTECGTEGLIEGRFGYVHVEDNLYGIWVGYDPPEWWYRQFIAWFTPDVRIAHAQCAITAANFNWSRASMRVCRLGPKGEPIELGEDE